MKTTRTRGEIVQECTDMVVACWNHYNDTPLALADVGGVQKALTTALPPVCSTSHWEEYARAYDLISAAEDDYTDLRDTRWDI